jgi:hypothetical protein
MEIVLHSHLSLVVVSFEQFEDLYSDSSYLCWDSISTHQNVTIQYARQS